MGGMVQPPIMMEEESTLPDLTAEGNRRKRQAAEELLIAGDEGSGMGSGLGSSGLGSGIMLSESGSGIDAMDPAKIEGEEEMNVTDTKTGLLQAENVIPVSTSSKTRSLHKVLKTICNLIYFS